MFDIRGEHIFYDGYKIARFEPVPFVGLTIEVERLLLDYEDPTDMVSEDDHLEAVDKAENEGYERGLKEGRDEGYETCEEENREKWETKAFEDGRADFAVDVARANQTERVKILIEAIQTAHDMLQETDRQRYPAAKTSERKRAMQHAMTTLRFALIDYNKPNGADE